MACKGCADRRAAMAQAAKNVIQKKSIAPQVQQIAASAKRDLQAVKARLQRR